MPKALPSVVPAGSTLALGGDEARTYLGVLRGLLGFARAGSQYPDPKRIEAFLSLLGPDGSRGARNFVDVDSASGLPAMHELVRVRAEREVASELVVRAGKRSSRRIEALRALAGADPSAISDVQVRLVERRGRLSRFLIVRDLLDVNHGCFVRFTFRLAQQGASHIALERSDLARLSSPFRRELERCSAADAEVALLLLSELPGLQVEDVVRGQIGPLSPPGGPAPAPLKAVLLAYPKDAVLHLTLERAGAGVAEDRCPDPFSRLYREGLSPAARDAAEERRALLGYRVSKERRLCCTPGLEAPLRAALAAAGRPLVVRAR
ncbi:MAG: hypothetical protein ACYC8T_39735 [Myxococcaceae bacterium]